MDMKVSMNGTSEGHCHNLPARTRNVCVYILIRPN